MLRNRSRVLLAAVLPVLATSTLRADAVEWIVDDNGQWTVPSNWSSNPDLPGAADDVTIDRPAGDYLITLDSGTQQINSLLTTERLTVSGSGLLEIGTTATLNNTLTLNSGTLRGGVWQSGNGSKIAATSGRIEGITLSLDLDLTQVNGANLQVYDGLTLTNSGILLGAADGSNSGHLYFQQDSVPAGVSTSQTLGGTGQIVFGQNTSNSLYNYMYGGGTGSTGTLTLGSGITVRGHSGQIVNGFSEGILINQGLISADTAGGTLTVGGTGSFVNEGTLQAVNGGTLRVVQSDNYAGGTLTGGTWRAGADSTVRLYDADITTLAATVELDGEGSQMYNAVSGTTSALAGLATISEAGSFTLTNGRDFTTADDLTSGGHLGVGSGSILTVSGDLLNQGSGQIELAGGTIAAGSMTNAGQIGGHGVIHPRPVNSGTILASGGSLVFSEGIAAGSGAVSAADGATIDVSAGSTASAADYLILDADAGQGGGRLNLGNNDFLVAADYHNQAAGSGNAYNPRANVSGSGRILADPSIQQSISGIGLSGGTSAMPTLDLGNVRVGDTVNADLTINVTGTGPALRGAVQTNNDGGNGGSITDGRLDIAGQSFGPVTSGAPSTIPLVFNAASAGPLVDQRAAIVNNFDNVANQLLTIQGTAYNAAAPTVAPANFDLGDFHVGDSIPTEQVLLTNAAPAGSFSEDAQATGFSASGAAIIAESSDARVVAGASHPVLRIGLDAGSAGARTGAVQMNLLSTGTVNGSTIAGLAPIQVDTQTVTVSADVYRLAAPVLDVSQPMDFGIVRVGDTVAYQMLTVRNDAAADGYSERLNAAFGTPQAGVETNSGSIGLLAAGQFDDASLGVRIGTASAGVIDAQVPIHFQSDGSGMNSLGQSDLPAQEIRVTGTVNNLANPTFTHNGGAGGFSGSGIQYMLDFGTLDQNESVIASLLLSNDIDSPADDLAGQWSFTDPDGVLGLGEGFDTFSGIAAGDSRSLSLTFDTSSLGSFAATITLMAESWNSFGGGLGLDEVTINITGSVVPEPGMLAVLGMAAGLLLRRQRGKRIM